MKDISVPGDEDEYREEEVEKEDAELFQEHTPSR